MKWYHSVLTKITLIFLVAVLGTSALVFIMAKSEKKREIEQTERLVRAMVRPSLHHKGIIEIQPLQNAGFQKISKESHIEKLDSEYANMHEEARGFGRNSKRAIRVFSYDGDLYLRIQTPMGEVLYFQSPVQKNSFARVTVPLFAIALLILLYIATIRSLLPLYTLRKNIKAFAEGDSTIECKSNKKDEIAALANEFDASVKKITKLKDSRQLFVRNMMHELKTPITKGKLVLAMLDDSNYKQTLQNVFSRQETLLEQFSRIEKLRANEIEIEKHKYTAEDIVDYAIDLLVHEKEKISLHIEPVDLQVDLELFATALKNLLDNGIIYSNDKKVSLHVNQGSIQISNKAKPLEYPLEKYAQAYFLGGSKQKSSRGLGFGLYISWHIILAHGMQLTYSHEAGTNIFTINLTN